MCFMRVHKMLKRIYLAGPISPKGFRSQHMAIDYLLNVRAMIEAGKELLLMGFSPFVPGLDYNFFLQLRDGEEITDKMIKDYSIDWLLACDAMVLLPGWNESNGTIAEILIAQQNGIPIYFSLEEFKNAIHPK